MDLIMPVMDGVEATRRIMAETPCAIVIVTVDRQQNVHRVFEAMGHGALDVVDTPALGAGNAQEAAAPLLRKILNIGWLIGDKPQRSRPAPTPQRSSASCKRLVAIGSSAGGPAALEVLLKGLPRDFGGNCAGAARRSGVRRRHGRMAGQRQRPRCASGPRGRTAAGRRGAAGRHQSPYSLIEKRHAGLHRRAGQRDLPPLDRCVFDSVASYWNGDAIGVLLTGMGRDGAQGLKLMRQQGYLTIAQDQQSSAVYGMPKAAAAIDAAVEIRALEKIAPRLLEVFPNEQVYPQSWPRSTQVTAHE